MKSTGHSLVNVAILICAVGYGAALGTQGDQLLKQGLSVAAPEQLTVVSEAELLAAGWLGAAAGASHAVGVPAPTTAPSKPAAPASQWSASGWDQDGDGMPDVFVLTPVGGAPAAARAPDVRQPETVSPGRDTAQLLWPVAGRQAVGPDKARFPAAGGMVR